MYLIFLNALEILLLRITPIKPSWALFSERIMLFMQFNHFDFQVERVCALLYWWLLFSNKLYFLLKCVRLRNLWKNNIEKKRLEKNEKYFRWKNQFDMQHNQILTKIQMMNEMDEEIFWILARLGWIMSLNLYRLEDSYILCSNKYLMLASLMNRIQSKI